MNSWDPDDAGDDDIAAEDAPAAAETDHAAELREARAEAARLRRQLAKTQRGHGAAARRLRRKMRPRTQKWIDVAGVGILAFYLIGRAGAAGGPSLIAPELSGCPSKTSIGNAPQRLQAELGSLWSATSAGWSAGRAGKVAPTVASPASTARTTTSASTTSTAKVAAAPAQPLASNGATALTADQMAQVVRAAGWTGDNVAIAVAVSKAESQWVPTQTEFGSGHGHGLFQIDDRYHQLGNWSDPQANADQAYKIWQSQGWDSGWTTYHTGAYQQYMGEATQAANRNLLASGPTVHTSPDVATTVSTVVHQSPACRTASATASVRSAVLNTSGRAGAGGVGAGGTMAGRGAAAFSLGHLGLQYVYGGNSLTSGTDCSGWTSFAWASQGVDFSSIRTADQQLHAFPLTSTPVPGSLAFPKSELHAAANGGAGHVELVVAVNGDTVTTSQEPNHTRPSYVGTFPKSSFVFNTPR